MAQPLRPMHPDGQWFQSLDPQSPPVYVVHPSHIIRLTVEGWKRVDDPRVDLDQQQHVTQQAKNDEQARHEHEQRLLDEIAALKAQLAKVDEGKQAKKKGE